MGRFKKRKRFKKYDDVIETSKIGVISPIADIWIPYSNKSDDVIEKSKKGVISPIADIWIPSSNKSAQYKDTIIILSDYKYVIQFNDSRRTNHLFSLERTTIFSECMKRTEIEYMVIVQDTVCFIHYNGLMQAWSLLTNTMVFASYFGDTCKTFLNKQDAMVLSVCSLGNKLVTIHSIGLLCTWNIETELELNTMDTIRDPFARMCEWKNSLILEEDSALCMYHITNEDDMHLTKKLEAIQYSSLNDGRSRVYDLFPLGNNLLISYMATTSIFLSWWNSKTGYVTRHNIGDRMYSATILGDIVYSTNHYVIRMWAKSNKILLRRSDDTVSHRSRKLYTINDKLVSVERDTISVWTRPDRWSPQNHAWLDNGTKKEIREAAMCGLVKSPNSNSIMRRLPRDVLFVILEICFYMAR
jgi:hypothetical protein